jgi:cytochrome c oxidase cbb3-type subunit 2
MIREIAGRDVTYPLAAAGSFLLFLAMLAVGYVLPAIDPSLAPQTPDLSGEAVRGQKLYSAEGCWFCHTQQVRPVANDLGLGPVTTSQSVAERGDPEFGLTRIGPDLYCAGDRIDDGEALAEHLRDPRVRRPESVMPSFSYLSETQLSDLVAYLQTLQCGGSG